MIGGAFEQEGARKKLINKEWRRGVQLYISSMRTNITYYQYLGVHMYICDVRIVYALV